MQARFNHKIEAIAVSDIRQFDMEVSQIEGIIKLTLGEPDFNTPEHVKQAAIAAINADQSHYTPNSGIMELRRAAADSSIVKSVLTVRNRMQINQDLKTILFRPVKGFV